MKLVDEKGRLFGLVNVIDLAVLLMVIAVGAGLVVKVVLPRLNDNTDKLKDVYVTVVCRQQPEAAAKQLVASAGESLIAKNDFVDGEVVSATYTAHQAVDYDSNGTAVMSDHPYLKDITVVLKGKADPEAAVFTLGTQEIRLGYMIYVKTNRVEVTGKIEGIVFEDAADAPVVTE